jgi:neurofibromin 1
LFRGTTIATRILSIYNKIVCGDYVRFTLLPAIEKICALPNDQLTWELDQQKIKNSEDVMKNKKNVIQATDILLNAICSSIDNAPM